MVHLEVARVEKPAGIITFSAGVAREWEENLAGCAGIGH